MEYKTSVAVKFSIEGFHSWPQAKDILPQVDFLSTRHRHIFYFTCKKKVNHNDRDVEIIMFRREILNYLQISYGKFEVVSNWIHSVYNNLPLFQYCEFEHRSCEMLAQELVEQFDLEYCEVLEDQENGATVEKV